MQDAGSMIHDKNPKRFGQLTILNQVEGQIQNSNVLNDPLTFTLLNPLHSLMCMNIST